MPDEYAYVEVESDGAWTVAVGWKHSETWGFIMIPRPMSGNAVVNIGKGHDDPGLFCAYLVRKPGTQYVRARIVVPFNPEVIRESEWQTVSPPDTMLSLCQPGYPPND